MVSPNPCQRLNDIDVLGSSAAMTMYQRARKLASLMRDPAEFHTIAELRLEAYTVSINALSLVDAKSAWFVLPAADEADREVSTCFIICEHPGNACSVAASETAKIIQVHTRREVLGWESRS